MRVLVTGSAGFIGGHLAHQLREAGHTVTGVDKRHGLSTSDWDQFWPAVQHADPEMIVHLGANCSTAVSLRDPGRDFADNAVGTFNIAEAARQAGGTPVIYMSTVKAEPGFDGTIAPLGLSKRVGEEYLRSYGALYGVPSVINRPSTVYGPGQNGTSDSGWFTWFIRAALTDQRIELAGDGTQSRDVLYIDDMVTLLVDQVEHFGEYLAACQLAAAGAFAMGGGPDNEVNLNDLLEELGHTNVVGVPRLPGDLQQVVASNHLVGRVRGWQPTIGWRDGLERTRNHLKEHL